MSVCQPAAYLGQQSAKRAVHSGCRDSACWRAVHAQGVESRHRRLFYTASSAAVETPGYDLTDRRHRPRWSTESPPTPRALTLAKQNKHRTHVSGVNLYFPQSEIHKNTTKYNDNHTLQNNQCNLLLLWSAAQHWPM